MKNRGCKVHLAVSCLMAGGLILAPPASAARYVPFEISIGKTVVLKGGTGDDGSPDADAVWGYLKSLSFRPVPGYRLPPDEEGDALTATLRGQIRIHSLYGGEATVSTLKLVRDPKDNSTWRIEPADVVKLSRNRKRPK